LAEKTQKAPVPSLTDFKNFSEEEGFSVIYSVDEALLAQKPSKKTDVVPESGDFSKKCQAYIGYLAYPNPKLKNKIPERQFFAYENLKSFKKPEISKNPDRFKTSGKLEQSVTKAQYLKKIKEIKELLAAGEIYQLNYAIRFRKKFEGSPYSLFLNLLKANPTEFSAFINCGDYQIISNSPERLFLKKNGKILTQPIKGTVTKQGGKRILERFLASEKERAELDMITDLGRNDIGRVCQYGTLKLIKERELMELKNLYHTYSEVEGELSPEVTNAEVVQAMFPGGSITGCPKKRAMHYIEKLEGLPRNIFTGSVILAEKNYIDANICIRTALVRDGYIEYWAGGGIVADSDPEAEYAECLLKAEKFISLL
jgi:para-aminobenzoate synthetase component 1